MAAFSYQHTPFIIDSVFLQNPPINLKHMSGFIEEEYMAQTHHLAPVERSQLDQSSVVGATDHNEASSLTKKLLSTESSSVVDKLENDEQVTQRMTCFNKKRKNTSGASFSSSQPKAGGQGTNKKRKKNNEEVIEGKNDPKAVKKDQKKVATEDPPVGYIHVRARRGQATDSHSLAERARREKISERMKILQHLVPGCDKVTGKALMLDEIINYVQSLQNQVEFLSMKLASVNPIFYEFGMDPEALMIRAEKLSIIESQESAMQHCNPTSPTTFIDANTTSTATTTTFGTTNNLPLIDSSLWLMLQGQRPIDFIQGPASISWDLEEQRQKFHSPSWLGNNLTSFR